MKMVLLIIFLNNYILLHTCGNLASWLDKTNRYFSEHATMMTAVPCACMCRQSWLPFSWFKVIELLRSSPSYVTGGPKTLCLLSICLKFLNPLSFSARFDNVIFEVHVWTCVFLKNKNKHIVSLPMVCHLIFRKVAWQSQEFCLCNV